MAINDINLDGPEFFTCKRFNARMLKIRCIERQEGESNIKRESFATAETGLSFEICKTCEQGKEIRDEIIRGKQRPRRGDGERKIKCALYGDCLDYAAKKDWKTFNCERCPLYQYKLELAGAMKPQGEVKNERICETEGCGRITLSPNNPLCPSCMAKRAAEKRRMKIKNHTKPPKTAKGEEGKRQGDHMHKSEIAAPGGDTASLTICFGRYLSVLKSVEKLAEEELRPVDLQVIYMLKNQLTIIQGDTDKGSTI